MIKATGTIRLGSRLPNLRTHLAIKGPGAGKLTVRRKPGTSSTFSIFTVSSHVKGGVRLSGISITNGLGSGVDTKGGLNLSHSVVSDNKGAGVEIDEFGTLTASQVRVRDNGGGGIEGDKRFAVDAGFASGLTTDQRGRPRIVNYPGCRWPSVATTPTSARSSCSDPEEPTAWVEYIRGRKSPRHPVRNGDQPQDWSSPSRSTGSSPAAALASSAGFRSVPIVCANRSA